MVSSCTTNFIYCSTNSVYSWFCLNLLDLFIIHYKLILKCVQASLPHFQNIIAFCHQYPSQILQMQWPMISSQCPLFFINKSIVIISAIIGTSILLLLHKELKLLINFQSKWKNSKISTKIVEYFFCLTFLLKHNSPSLLLRKIV